MAEPPHRAQGVQGEPPLITLSEDAQAAAEVLPLTASSWSDLGSVRSHALPAAEAALARSRGAPTLAAWLQQLRAEGTGGGGPCTAVWQVNTIAYR